MIVSETGLKLIAEFEGFSPVPYNDPVGHCTVGYGELLHLGNCTPEELARPPITAAEGRARLAAKVKPYAAAVERSSRPLKQQEFDALTSLCYNIGQGGYQNSGVRRAVNANTDPCPALRLIVTGTDGVTYPGLVRRREAECKMFHSTAPVPIPTEPEEDEMKIAGWWTGKTFQSGHYEINLVSDFGPGKAYELCVVLTGDSAGDVSYSHGDFKLAGTIKRGERAKTIVVVPGQFGTAPFDVVGTAKFQYVACSGVIP